MNWKKENISLVKEFTFNNFVGAVDFINRIVPLAQNANHHPDILIHGYNKVKILLSTHSENAITEKDYALAEQIDALGS